ncbi:hypothetical protein N0V84_011511 [Fusarium piperis]|uniref:Uncharacterized protein n=1 Tax=Fusarium piperis TaxID=1435070 RepID=A0A9W8W449_9HYPO|nr:hypothetical protein N0V84_011511 [Fusarium piperis]
MADNVTRPEPEPVDDKNLETQEVRNDDAASKAMILKNAWSRTSLAIAFLSLFLTTLVITFSDYSGLVLESYVTSEFRSHSAMSSARVVMNITRIVAYPVIAKLSDTAGLFDAIGATGFTLVQQAFLADATNLVDRAFSSTVPESITTIPALYLGTIMGYGTWAIVTPIVAVPLIITISILQKRAKKHGLQVKTFSAVAGYSPDSPMWKKVFHLIWTEIDFLGLILPIAGLSLILISVSLTGSLNPQRRKEGSFIAMLVVGAICFAAFLVWDLKYAQKPHIPWRMANKTVIAGCAIQMFDFLGYPLFTIFFPSYLQVAGQFSPGHATRIDNSLRVVFQISGLFVAVGMKYTKNAQYWILAGPNGDSRQVSVQAVVSRQEVAVVTGLFQAATSVGGALSTSISGAIWRKTLPTKLAYYLPEENRSNSTLIFQDIVTAKSYLPGTDARAAINPGYSESQMILAIVATCFCVPNLVIMFFMKNMKLDEEDEKDEKGIIRAIAKIEQQGEQ